MENIKEAVGTHFEDEISYLDTIYNKAVKDERNKMTMFKDKAK